MRKLALIALALVSILAACAKPRASGHLTMPHPEGCYVEVFDAAGFRGNRDFINGPVKHATLSELPGGGNWKRRVLSLKAGPAATVRAWAAEDFAGASLRLRPEQQAPTLSEAFSAKIESLQIECRPENAAPLHVRSHEAAHPSSSRAPMSR